jgi:peptidyl-prolyl cis-trans isomerase-like 1
VKKLGLVKTDKEDRPVEEVKIIKAYLVDDGAFAMQRY